jgi:hypothetical protein
MPIQLPSESGSRQHVIGLLRPIAKPASDVGWINFVTAAPETSVSVERMCRVVGLLLSLALVPVAASAQAIATSDDIAVVRAVLEAQTLPELVENWGITAEGTEIVISDELSGCGLPLGDEETKRVNAALERLTAGQSVPEEELRYRAAPLDEDLVVSPGHVVPREIVQQCVVAGAAHLPQIAVKSPVTPVFEDGDVVAAEFRKRPHAWERRHPRSVGVVTMGRPVYARDRSIAGVSYSRLRNGFGGGSFFCLLEKRDAGWRVVWQETILIE